MPKGKAKATKPAVTPDTPEIPNTPVEKKRKEFECARCGAEYKKGDSKCPYCLAPTNWEN